MQSRNKKLSPEQIRELKKRGFQIQYLETPKSIETYVKHHKLIAMYHANNLQKAYNDLDALHPKQLTIF